MLKSAMTKPEFALSPIVDEASSEEEVSPNLQMVCRRLPVLEKSGTRPLVEAVGSAINKVSSKLGLCQLDSTSHSETEFDEEASASTLRRRVATTGSNLNEMPRNAKRLSRHHSLDADAVFRAIHTRGLGPRLCGGSPAKTSTMQELGLPLIFRRNSQSLMNMQLFEPKKQPSQLIAEEKLRQESSQTRASILDFEHLFVQYFVEVKPRRSRTAQSPRGVSAQPTANEVVAAWKEANQVGFP
ncbi:unnamed protein product [Effrenium voratum]|nr:unnamed protein product [Effrenium voratum]